MLKYCIVDTVNFWNAVKHTPRHHHTSLTGSCAALGLGGRAVDLTSSLAAVFLLTCDLDCWDFAAWLLTEKRSWKHRWWWFLQFFSDKWNDNQWGKKKNNNILFRYLGDGAHGFGATLPEHQLLVTVQVLWRLNEAEVNQGLVPRPQTRLVHGQDGGRLSDAAAVNWDYGESDRRRPSSVSRNLEF